LLVFLLIAYCIPLLYEYTDGLGFGGLVLCICSYSDLLGPKFLAKSRMSYRLSGQFLFTVLSL
jgi:hypothetical protein